MLLGAVCRRDCISVSRVCQKDFITVRGSVGETVSQLEVSTEEIVIQSMAEVY